MGLGVEYGCPFVLEGPDGSRAVFNDSADEDYVGILNPEECSGLDSADVREDLQALTEADGAVQGNNWYGARPVVLGGTIIASSKIDRNKKVAKLKAATNAMRGDATLTWAPPELEGDEVELKLRRQQPLRVTKGYVKMFQAAMVAGDAFIKSVVSHGAELGATITNAGTADAFPIIKLYSTAAQSSIANATVGSSLDVEWAPFGNLTPLSPATLTVGSLPASLAVSPDGKSVYSADGSAGTLRQFERDAATGKLVPLSPATLTVGASPFLIAISPDGKSVYSTDSGGNTVRQFERNTTTGKLTPLSPETLTVGNNPNGIAVSPDGKSVYSTDSGGTTLRQFERNTTTGKLTALSPATLTVGSIPYEVIVSPDGKSVYSTDAGGSTIRQFERDTTTGKLTPLSPETLAVGSSAAGLAISPDGKSVYSTDSGGTTLRQFERNTTTGKLTALSPATLTVGAGPRGVAVSPDGKSVYSTDGSAGTLRQFERNTTTGKLTPLSPAWLEVASTPTGVIVSPDGKSVYSTDSGGTTLRQFERSPYLEIDFNNRTIKANGETSASSALVFASSDWWELAPGENEIAVIGANAEIEWQDAYL